jgi:hypothetical protein
MWREVVETYFIFFSHHFTYDEDDVSSVSLWTNREGKY